MKSPSLTSNPRRVKGRLVHDYEINGTKYAIRDSAKNGLLVIELFTDPNFGPGEKAALFSQMLFADPDQIPDDYEEYIEVLVSVMWDAFGIDMRNEHEHEKKVFDWDADAGRVRASLFMAYGLDWDEVSTSRSYAEVCDLLAMLMEADSKTPFQEAVFYRCAKVPNGRDVNPEYRSAFIKRKQHFELHEEPTAQELKSSDERASDVFESLWRAAQNG